MRSLLALSVIGLFGCKKPPEAPAKLDDLCAYLYTHMGDEDDEALAAGLGNLDIWLDNNIATTAEGYTVNNLDESTVSDIYDEDVDLTGLVGAAVGSDSAHSTIDLADAIALENPTAVYPDTYEFYDRTYDGDKDCYADHSCTSLDVDNHSKANYSMGLQAESWSHGQYRWVELDTGWAMIQRTWLTADVVMNYDWIQLGHQFYFAVSLPRDTVEARRLQATWMVAELVGASVPEATALKMVVGSMQDDATALDTYLEANP